MHRDFFGTRLGALPETDEDDPTASAHILASGDFKLRLGQSHNKDVFGNRRISRSILPTMAKRF